MSDAQRKLLEEIGKGVLKERYIFKQLEEFMPRSPKITELKTQERGCKARPVTRSQPDAVRA